MPKKRRISRTESRARDIKALQMRMAGYTYQEISDQLKYGGAGNARNGVDRLLKKYETDLAKEYRLFHAKRLDELLTVWWPKALYPNNSYEAHKEQLDATKAVLSIMKQKAELLGLNVDQKLQAKRDEEEQYEVLWDLPLVEKAIQKLESGQANGTTSSESNGKQSKQ